jgi:Fic family protein
MNGCIHCPPPTDLRHALADIKYLPVPPIDFAPFQERLDRANQSLGRLDCITSILPDTPLFL